jgi:hypothetical protein
MSRGEYSQFDDICIFMQTQRAGNNNEKPNTRTLSADSVDLDAEK